MKILLSFVIIFVFAFAVYSQAKPKIPPIITIDAVTKDGKAVTLKSDGTWEYNENATAAANGTISIEAGLVYRSGDSKPIARAEILLLDKSLDAILSEVGWKSSSANIAPNSDYALNYIYGKPQVAQATAAIKSHSQQTVSTDFNGKASFANVANGSYFIFCIYKTPRGVAAWNLPVEVKNGVATITLDQNNAFVAL